VKKYLVATCNKDTGEINFKHIEAESGKDAVIEEYIDSMGNVLWAIYQPGIKEADAKYDFQRYVEWYMKNNTD
jgi:hypothetical protein